MELPDLRFSRSRGYHRISGLPDCRYAAIAVRYSLSMVADRPGDLRRYLDAPASRHPPVDADHGAAGRSGTAHHAGACGYLSDPSGPWLQLPGTLESFGIA